MNQKVLSPVISITSFSSDAEAIALANNETYGQAAYIWTLDQTRTRTVSEALRYRMVGVNKGVRTSAKAKLGAIRNELLREKGSCGPQEYLDIKDVTNNVVPTP